MGDTRIRFVRAPGVIVVALAVLCSGCLIDGLARTKRQTLTPSYGAVQVTGQQYAGTVAVGMGYTIDVQLSTTASCTRTVATRTRVTTTREKKYFVGSILSFVYGGIMVVTGAPLYLIPAGDTEEVNDDGNSTRQEVGKYVMYTGGVLVVTPFIYKALKTSGSSTSRTETGAPSQQPMTCPSGAADPTGALMVRAPWGHQAQAVLQGGRASVRVDWSSAKLDPLAPNATAALSGQWGVWTVDGKYRGTWTPTPADIDKMLHAVGAAAGIELEAKRGGPRPALSIKRLVIGDGGVLNAGERVEIRLTLENKGRGPAYRVIAKTKSGMRSLRGLQFSYGLIRPGESKSAVVVVDVPRQASGSREPMIFQIEEYNDNVPRARTEQVTIRPSVRPAMRVACHLEGPRKNHAGQFSVDAGKSFGLVCDVENTGGAPAKGVTMNVRMGGRSQVSNGGEIRPGGSKALKVSLTVPKSAQLDEQFAVRVVVSETNFNTSQKWNTNIYAGTPSVCPSKLTDAQYRERRKKLESLRDEGILSTKEFDQRHAELVDCLQ